MEIHFFVCRLVLCLIIMFFKAIKHRYYYKVFTFGQYLSLAHQYCFRLHKYNIILLVLAFNLSESCLAQINITDQLPSRVEIHKTVACYSYNY